MNRYAIALPAVLLLVLWLKFGLPDAIRFWRDFRVEYRRKRASYPRMNSLFRAWKLAKDAQ